MVLKVVRPGLVPVLYPRGTHPTPRRRTSRPRAPGAVSAAGARATVCYTGAVVWLRCGGRVPHGTRAIRAWLEVERSRRDGNPLWPVAHPRGCAPRPVGSTVRRKT